MSNHGLRPAPSMQSSGFLSASSASRSSESDTIPSAVDIGLGVSIDPPPPSELRARDLELAGPSGAVGEAPPAHPSTALPSRSSSWGAALSSGAWAAVRELGAQGTGALAGVAVRTWLAGAGGVAVTASGTVAAAVLGAAAYRGATLAGASIYAQHEQTPTWAHAGLAAVPILVAAAAVSCAAGSGTLVGAGAYLTGKLVQRCVRDLLSTTLDGVLPGSELIDAQGEAVPKGHQGEEDWGRAIGNFVPTTAFFLAQDVLAPAPDPADGLAAALPYVAATALVEAARSVTGTLLTAVVAHRQDRLLQPKAGGGCEQLAKNLTRKTLVRAADATAMRQSIGLFGDALAVVMGRPAQPMARIIFKLLRSELKALGEFRSLAVAHGAEALKQRQVRALADGASQEAVVVAVDNTGVLSTEEPVRFHMASADPRAPRLRNAMLPV